MTQFLNILNEGREVLIDSEMQNYSLLASGTANVPELGTTINFTEVVFGTPLVFVRFHSTKQYAGMTVLTKSSAKFQIYGSNVPNPGNGYLERQIGVLEYQIFGVASSILPNGNAGLQCFNNGILVYDSNRPSPRISEICINPFPIQAPANTNRQPQTFARAHNSGLSPWMMINASLTPYGFVFLQDSPSNTSVLLQPAFRSEPEGIRMGCVQAYSIGSQGRYWEDIIIPVPLMK